MTRAAALGLAGLIAIAGTATVSGHAASASPRPSATFEVGEPTGPSPSAGASPGPVTPAPSPSQEPRERDPRGTGISVTVPAVAVGQADGLPYRLTGPRTWVSSVPVWVARGVVPASATVSARGAVVRGCSSGPLRPGHVTRLHCRLTVAAAPGTSVTVTVVVRAGTSVAERAFHHLAVAGRSRSAAPVPMQPSAGPAGSQ